ncbi:hypothetical protein BKA83DRAFT_96544 [Pisolithus microcarpus]|nr:hypothetical protein BKA83DRAFT_96544 [Pisolithus microcarpus]
MTYAGHFCLGEHFKGTVIIYGIGDTFLRHFDMDRHFHCQTNMYYPFTNFGDWEMANFLLQLNLSMREMKKMLLSFWTAKELCKHIEDLPKGLCWKVHIVPTRHPTTNPVQLYWHDSLKCIEALFNHLFYTGKMDYSPFRVFTAAERVMRVYSEWMSSDGAWDLQTKVPIGSTICSVILSSDKTNITNVCGGKVAHPLLISLATIRMNVQNKGSSHAFLLTALMPIAEFIYPIMRIHLVLEARLFHACLDFVLEPLKKAAQFGQMMADPLGNICFCFTPLLESIPCDPNDIEAYFDACAQFRLSGILRPFWRDWLLSDPHRFLTLECLHHWHHMSWDHNVKWCKCALGSEELDFHFSLLPPITGLRQFKSGITKLKQVGGCTQCDIQRYLVIVIAGTAHPDVVAAVHALTEFHYLAQAPAITEEGCEKIAAALAKFHHYKQAIIDRGLHRGDQSGSILEHWEIPKLELLQSVVPSISQVGSVLQWSADTTEHTHIEICHHLDRVEKCRMFDTTVCLHRTAEAGSSSSAVEHDRDQSDGEVDHVVDDVGEAEAAVLNDLWAPKQSPSDFFEITAKLLASTTLSSSPLCTFVHGSTAFHLNFHPTFCHLSVDAAAEKFAIPDLRSALGDYLALYNCLTRQSAQDILLPFEYLQIWYKVCIQQRVYHDRASTALVYTIHAQPPNGHWKYGHYDAAILQVDEGYDWPDSGLTGHAVVEVCLIMCPCPPKGINVPWANHFLVYVRRFDVVNVEPSTHLHMLKWAVRASGSYFGDVFPLDQISSFAHSTMISLILQSLYYYSLAGSSINGDSEQPKGNHKARLWCYQPPLQVPPPSYTVQQPPHTSLWISSRLL